MTSFYMMWKLVLSIVILLPTFELKVNMNFVTRLTLDSIVRTQSTELLTPNIFVLNYLN